MTNSFTTVYIFVIFLSLFNLYFFLTSHINVTYFSKVNLFFQ